MDMQQQMISFQTGLMRALETATVAATAARGAADAAQGSGRPSGPPETASVPNFRFGQSTTRIHPIKKSHDEALKYFENQALLRERTVRKLVRTQKEIDRLHVCDQCDGTKQIQRAEIHLPTWYISVQSAFGRCGDERGLAGVIGERLCFIIHDSERHEQEKRDEHQPSREQHLHPKSDTTGSDCSSCLRQSIILETGFPPDLGLEDVDCQGVDPKAAEHHALEIYRKMIDRVCQKAAAEEKKKDDDLRKKRRCPKNSRTKSPETFWSQL